MPTLPKGKHWEDMERTDVTEKNLVVFQFKQSLSLEGQRKVIEYVERKLPKNWVAFVLDECDEQCVKFSTHLTEQEKIAFSEFLLNEHDNANPT